MAQLAEPLPHVATCPADLHAVVRVWGIPARRVAWAGLGGLLLTTLITVCSAKTLILAPETTRGLPWRLAGVFAGMGVNLHRSGVIATFVIMGVSYGTVLAAGKRHRLPRRPLIATIIALDLLVAVAPPLLSTDLFSYGAYGRMGAVYDLNPYRLAPTVIQFDPSFAYVSAWWITTPSTYGPLFTALAYVIAPLSVALTTITYKALAMAASLVGVVGVHQLAHHQQRDPVRAVAFVGLNPVLLFYAVGGGRNDLLMLVALIGAGVCLSSGRDTQAGVLVLTALAVKLTAGITLPFVVVSRIREQAARRLLLGLLLAGTALCGSSFRAVRWRSGSSARHAQHGAKSRWRTVNSWSSCVDRWVWVDLSRDAGQSRRRCCHPRLPPALGGVARSSVLAHGDRVGDGSAACQQQLPGALVCDLGAAVRRRQPQSRASSQRDGAVRHRHDIAMKTIPNDGAASPSVPTGRRTRQVGPTTARRRRASPRCLPQPRSRQATSATAAVPASRERVE